MIPSWARAHGAPVCDAFVRSEPADFRVIEDLGFVPDGEGEHRWLWIEKTGANTPWVARQLARIAGVKARDVGYSGMKDRQAVTQQWFSLPKCEADLSSLDIDGVTVLDMQRHSRKLRRGTHKRNQFILRLRGERIASSRSELESRLSTIAEQGVPNYFGEQRFGRDGNNIEQAKAVLAGRRVPRDRRSILLSAARSWLFNQILDARVGAGTWNQILPGERANLAGSSSVFAVETPDETLVERCQNQDIHPTASLWGRGAPQADGLVADLEHAAVAAFSDLSEGLIAQGLRADQRSTRLVVENLAAEFDDESLTLHFALGRGGYATAVLRELVSSL